MHAQRKPLPSTRYHLPQGTRRELRGQVIRWRDAAMKQQSAPAPVEEQAAPVDEELLPPAMSGLAGDIGLILLAGAAAVVFGLRMRGLL